MSIPSEEQEKLLLEKLKSGDHTAFREIFDAYYKYLTVTAYRYVNDGEKAKDLAHDAFVEIWNKRAETNIHNLKSYLRQIVVNKSLNYIKREKRIDFSEPANLPETPVKAVAQDDIEANDTKEIIQKSIDNLPNKCRIVFVMSRFEEKSHKEISSELGISTKTIENQITRALKAIRAALKQHSLPILILIAIFSAIYGG